jgi:adenine deaminase
MLSRIHAGVLGGYYVSEVAKRELLVKTALGFEKSDIVLKNGNLINVCSEEIEHRIDVAIKGDRIALVGNASGTMGPETQVFDLTGKYIAPGFVDAHMHFESSMLTVVEFAKASLPTGTTTLIADPHEIANAVGYDGVFAMIDEYVNSKVPQRVWFAPPSLVPDCPGLETPGSEVSIDDIKTALDKNEVIGLGEEQGFTNVDFVMKYAPNLLPRLIEASVYALDKGKNIQGNAPLQFGPQLAAHLITGPMDCHETTDAAEAIEKIRRGMKILMREGSTQKNLAACLRGVREGRLGTRFCVHATDDMCPPDLLDPNVGHVNNSIRRAMEEGFDVIKSVQMGTINPAEHFHLDRDLGSITPGKLADIAVVGDVSVKGWKTTDVLKVFVGGRLVAERGKLIIDIPRVYTYPDRVRKSMDIKPKLQDSDFMVYAPPGKNKVKTRVIGLIEFENLSESLSMDIHVTNSRLEANTKDDLLKICVVGRYKANAGKVSKGFVTGFKMKRGAVAESVSHDCHNIMVLGTNDNDMAVAANSVIEMQGGVAVANNGKVLGKMALPIAGLISEYDISECNRRVNELVELIAGLGCPIHMPLMHLAFLSLSTSPWLKITDKGYVEAQNYRVVPLFID